MTDEEWRRVFTICAERLPPGPSVRVASPDGSWCAWTTFDRLQSDAGYWTRGLPAAQDLETGWLKDSGVWGQPFRYQQLAHLILPRQFYWERGRGPDWTCGFQTQDIDVVSTALAADHIAHRLTDLLLEIKLY